MLNYYADVASIPPNRMRLLYNDVDLNRFAHDSKRDETRDQVRAELGLERDAGIILFVHRLSPVRRTLMYLPSALVQARDAGALDDWHLVVVGGGPDLPALLREVEASGLSDRVISLGEKANFGLERLYLAADLFIQPSHAEGFPRVVIEAMAAGLPMVATDAGGAEAIVGHLQRAWVTPKDLPQAFGHVMVEALSNADLRRRVAEENTREVRRFSTPRVATMYREVLFGDR
jgi:glycosyltransferase involved in cell wall biosynthesis